MSDHNHTVILVQSTSHAIRAEKVLQKVNIVCKLIPVPRHLSSDCGVCVRIQYADKEAAIQILTDEMVQFEEIHDLT